MVERALLYSEGDLANLLRGLLRGIGIDGTTLYIWAGPDTGAIRRYTIGSTGVNSLSFRIIRGLHDGALQTRTSSFTRLSQRTVLGMIRLTDFHTPAWLLVRQQITVHRSK